MAIRPIRLYGDPVLTTRSTEITDFGPALQAVVDDMLETMDDAGGVGLAANQIGLTQRIFVYDCSHVQEGMRGAIINPVWEAVGEETQTGNEGCLSIPEISAETTRFEKVRVSGQDPQGREIGMVVSGLMARCVQHETDHLDGVLFIRRLEPAERKRVMGEIRTAEWFNS